jgi:hypothetical protein
MPVFFYGQAVVRASQEYSLGIQCFGRMLTEDLLGEDLSTQWKFEDCAGELGNMTFIFALIFQ